MKIAVLGAGAMGSVIGGLLAKAANNVTLVDVYKPIVDAINAPQCRQTLGSLCARSQRIGC